MKQKMLKLIKILNQFTIDDVLTVSEFDENETKKLLTEFEDIGFIKKISEDKYLYIPESPRIIFKPTKIIDSIEESQTVEQKTPQTIDTLFTKAGEQQIYDNAPKYAKKYLVKYYTILKMAGGLKGNNLESFLKQIGREYPEYKISVSTYHRIKTRYLYGGLQALIPRYSEGMKSTVPQEMYDEFKKLYLRPSNYSLKECVGKLEFKFDKDTIPGFMCFRRRLYKDFSPEVISKMRTMSEKLPNLKFIEEQYTKKKNTNYTKYDYFIDGARDYMNYLKHKTDKESATMKSAINNHLMPFFKNYRFSDISQDLILSFQNKKIEEGYSVGSIKRFITILSNIYYKHSNCRNNIQFSSHNNLILSTENPILSDENIKKIIKTRSPELWILCHGITPAELAGLEYSDINYNDQTVKISKVFYNSGLKKYRKNYKVRTLKLHPLIYNYLEKKSRGAIFGNVHINNYDILLNTHVKLLLEQNYPINLIYKNLGYHYLNDFENRFNFLLPRSAKKDFDILQNYI